jgi:S1-C subfamily serine protease
MFRSPDVKNIGITLDVPRGLAVRDVSGPASAGGMRAGDRIAALNGTPVWTFGDFQYQYDQISRRATSIDVTVDRGGEAVRIPIALPPRWWLTDIRYKQLTIDPRVYFESRPLAADEKKQRNLPLNGFASMVTYVSSFAATLKSHELQTGDIITAVDGAATDEFANTADLYIRLRKKAGDEVRLDVIRNGQPVAMTLKTFRMSFRK